MTQSTINTARRLRVTFVLPCLSVNGGTRVVAIHAAHLMKRGHTVTVVAPPIRDRSFRNKFRLWRQGGGWPAPVRDDPSLFADRGVPFRQLSTNRPVGDGDVPDADVVVATWWETAQWVQALHPGKGVKAYFIQHDERVICPEESERVAQTYRDPGVKIVVAQWLQHLLAKEFGQRATLAGNGVDLRQFQAPPRGKQAPPRIGFMHAPSQFKGLDVMLKALQLAKEYVPELRTLAFATAAPTPGFPLPTGCEFFLNPPQDALGKHYAACDAWLVCSRCEGFGLPVLEAMACRTPVIATPTGAAPELLRDGGGMLVPIDNPAATADAIVRVARMDDAPWRAMSQAAWTTAQDNGWERASATFEAAVLEAAVRGGSGADVAGEDSRGA